jgi:sensor histidine kinase YesM
MDRLLKKLIVTAGLSVLAISCLLFLVIIYINIKFHQYLIVIAFPIISMSVMLWVINLLIYNFIGLKSNYLQRFSLAYLIVFVLIFIGDRFVSKPENISIIIPETPFIVSFIHNVIINLIMNIVIFSDKNKEILRSNEELQINTLNLQNALLKQNIQPHFLFNSLNVLKSLIHQNPIEAEQFLINVSNHLRNNIDYGNKDLIAINKELEFGLEYLKIMQIRFKNALSFVVTYQEKFNDNKMIPVFSLQVLFENAIKHNHFTIKNPLIIEVFINTNEIVVKNNFAPIKSNANIEHGFGLNNFKERYLLLVNRPIEVLQTSNNFEVKLPILKHI